MDKFKHYNVSFAGLPLGKHDFEFYITQSFFDLYKFEQDFYNPNLKIHLTLNKKNTFLELEFTLTGELELDCDITNESFQESLNSNTSVIVKFGEEFDDSDDEVWVIPQGEYQLNIAQMIYEMILLAIPIKRIHPDVKNGESHSEMLKLLEKYELHDGEKTESQAENEDIDPRWEQLKKLKNNNN